MIQSTGCAGIYIYDFDGVQTLGVEGGWHGQKELDQFYQYLMDEQVESTISSFFRLISRGPTILYVFFHGYSCRTISLCIQAYEDLSPEQKQEIEDAVIGDHKEIDDLLVYLITPTTLPEHLVRHPGSAPPYNKDVPQETFHTTFAVQMGQIYAYRVSTISHPLVLSSFSLPTSQKY